MRDDQSAGNAEISGEISADALSPGARRAAEFREYPADAEIAALAQRVATARGKLPLQTDPALFEELSESEISAERDLAEWIRGQRRRQRRRAVSAELAAEKRDRRVALALRRSDDADARWHRKALAARRRVSNPDARLAQLYRRAEWSSRALIGVVVLGMVWAGVNVQQNLVPSGDMSDPLYWLSYGFEAMISIPIITIMVVATTAARWGREIARGKVVFLEAALLGVTIALNAGPHLAAGAAAHAAEAAVAPVMVGVVIWLHAWVSTRYAQLIDGIPEHAAGGPGRTFTHSLVDAFAAPARSATDDYLRMPRDHSDGGTFPGSDPGHDGGEYTSPPRNSPAPAGSAGIDRPADRRRVNGLSHNGFHPNDGRPYDSGLPLRSPQADHGSPHPATGFTGVHDAPHHRHVDDAISGPPAADRHNGEYPTATTASFPDSGSPRLPADPADDVAAHRSHVNGLGTNGFHQNNGHSNGNGLPIHPLYAEHDGGEHPSGTASATESSGVQPHPADDVRPEASPPPPVNGYDSEYPTATADYLPRNGTAYPSPNNVPVPRDRVNGVGHNGFHQNNGRSNGSEVPLHSLHTDHNGPAVDSAERPAPPVRPVNGHAEEQAERHHDGIEPGQARDEHGTTRNTMDPTRATTSTERPAGDSWGQNHTAVEPNHAVIENNPLRNPAEATPPRANTGQPVDPLPATVTDPPARDSLGHRDVPAEQSRMQGSAEISRPPANGKHPAESEIRTAETRLQGPGIDTEPSPTTRPDRSSTAQAHSDDRRGADRATAEHPYTRRTLAASSRSSAPADGEQFAESEAAAAPGAEPQDPGTDPEPPVMGGPGHEPGARRADPQHAVAPEDESHGTGRGRSRSAGTGHGPAAREDDDRRGGGTETNAGHPHTRPEAAGRSSASSESGRKTQARKQTHRGTQLALDEPPVDVSEYRRPYVVADTEPEAVAEDSVDAGTSAADLAAEIDNVGVWAVAREISERRLSKLPVEQLAEILTLADESWTPAAIGASIGLPGSRILGILDAARRIRLPYAVSG
ncbi:hypothetical protein [Nocardia sp. BMG51109]|uniref:hypothetical protein n=1 Tax=Nocardia sp. BMG51109 TaxID=1056816 RepID=UPI000463762F|nr:hypothetical protein [Nocardia sp. BMG51109]